MNMALGFHTKFPQNKEYKRKILIVDDDRETVHALQRILLMSGKYEIEVAYDGISGLQKFYQSRKTRLSKE